LKIDAEIILILKIDAEITLILKIDAEINISCRNNSLKENY